MQKIKKINKGFVLLFTMVLSSILLAISVGVSNIALNEINFSTSAKDTNNAFFAADTGIECALRYDRSDNNAFTGPALMNCAGNSITPTPSGSPASFWSFVVPRLGSDKQSCAIVSVDKSVLNSTKIISKGYNIGDPTNCTSTNTNRVERELEANY